MLAIIGGVMIPMDWVTDYVLWFALVLIVFGVPHGASDYIIYRQIAKLKAGSGGQLRFGLYYAVAIGLYGFIWWLSPLVAFAIFILVSAYHFGQSNWHFIQFNGEIRRVYTFLLWGMAVIGVPVLLHHEEAALIIYEITGHELYFSEISAPLIFGLIMFNLVHITILYEQGLIDRYKLYRELSNFILLIALFVTTPLLIGFGIYFMFWHSLGSSLDQVRAFKQKDEQYNIRKYIYHIIPLTIIAFLGLGAFYYFLGDQMNQGINLGAFFLFIAIITVPHSILMDKLYAQL
jgi:Brp/Blh family beta-carotene 15,15'-monooxygenase